MAKSTYAKLLMQEYKLRSRCHKDYIHYGIGIINQQLFTVLPQKERNK